MDLSVPLYASKCYFKALLMPTGKTISEHLGMQRGQCLVLTCAEGKLRRNDSVVAMQGMSRPWPVSHRQRDTVCTHRVTVFQICLNPGQDQAFRQQPAGFSGDVPVFARDDLLSLLALPQNSQAPRSGVPFGDRTDIGMG